MMAEGVYRNKKASVLKDEKGEYEWIESENFAGKMEKVKKYKDPKAV